MTSFTPFIVTFLHAIAATSTEDTALLNSIVEMLGEIKDASLEMKRLHQICASFLHIAARLVESRTSPMENYDMDGDILSFSDNAAQLSIFDNDFLPGMFGSDILGPVGDSIFPQLGFENE